MKGVVQKTILTTFAYDGYQGKRTYRHELEIKLPDNQIIVGMYDSVLEAQTKFVVGQEVEFDLEVRHDKSNKPWNKIKPAKPSSGGGYTESPEVRAQIQRSSCLKRIAPVISAFKTTNPSVNIKPGELVLLLNAWVVERGTSKQPSINSMAALESATSMIEIRNITNVDHLLEYADQLFKYIQGDV